MGRPNEAITDELIDWEPGDVFFGLDFQPVVQTSNANFYQQLRLQGVTVKFMVYDLLCLTQPEHFFPGSAESFTIWLQVVGECDGAVCISQAVADELSQWMAAKKWNRPFHFQIDTNHLGADVVSSFSTSGLVEGTDKVLKTLKERPSFLMVGTIEPRKGYQQTLNAFESLWKSNTNVNLVIVGKQGWMVEQLVDTLRTHQELGKRLFWLEGISDKYLEKVYAASSCLIIASYGEGFGLPLIEAARYGLPIITRDLPVFREVAGDYAYYFENKKESDIVKKALIDWLKLYEVKRHPKSDNITRLSWKLSSNMLLNKLELYGNASK
jgi:glycosyltransferase involved in cell wall biosynthesis